MRTGSLNTTHTHTRKCAFKKRRTHAHPCTHTLMSTHAHTYTHARMHSRACSRGAHECHHLPSLHVAPHATQQCPGPRGRGHAVRQVAPLQRDARVLPLTACCGALLGAWPLLALKGAGGHALGFLLAAECGEGGNGLTRQDSINQRCSSLCFMATPIRACRWRKYLEATC